MGVESPEEIPRDCARQCAGTRPGASMAFHMRNALVDWAESRPVQRRLPFVMLARNLADQRMATSRETRSRKRNRPAGRSRRIADDAPP